MRRELSELERKSLLGMVNGPLRVLDTPDWQPDRWVFQYWLAAPVGMPVHVPYEPREVVWFLLDVDGPLGRAQAGTFIFEMPVVEWFSFDAIDMDDAWDPWLLNVYAGAFDSLLRRLPGHEAAAIRRRIREHPHGDYWDRCASDRRNDAAARRRAA